MMKWVRAFSLALAVVGVACMPTVPREYTAVIQMKMPYIGLEMTMRVLTSAAAQKIEYYDGLEVDVSSPKGTYKYAFNNSRRACLYSPPSSGPTAEDRLATGAAWAGSPFLPDLSSYNYSGQELVGGVMCQKFTLDAHHGSLGTMDDHISFYWDPVLDKPVRWHMHARHVTFGSHTDEYIMDYLSFQPGAPTEADLQLPAECARPRQADISIQIGHFLEAAHAMRAPLVEGDAAPLLFDAFLKQYGKSYAAQERAFRQTVFERNARLVKQLNEKHAGRTSFRVNQFLDMTREEVLGFRGGKAKTLRSERRTPEQQQFVRMHAPSRTNDLPKNFDWRTARPGVVGPVKDQAMCGSCWTYGLTGPIESIQAIRTGKLTLVPEQFVLDCTWTTGTGSSGSNSGCDGGDSDIGALEIVRKFGGVIPTSQAYGSYLSINGFCKDTRLMDVGAKLTGWVDIKARDEQALMQALVSQGPISLSIMVPDDMLFYDSGVLRVASCKRDPKQIDHSVVLVGFGTDEQGGDYYVVRNSWSMYWGDEGYIKIARGDLDCCVTCEPGYPEVAVAASASLVV